MYCDMLVKLNDDDMIEIILLHKEKRQVFRQPKNVVRSNKLMGYKDMGEVLEICL